MASDLDPRSINDELTLVELVNRVLDRGVVINGDLVITGRAKDLIKSGGEWINPAEIEAVINEHPAVSLAAVIGRPDPKWGERPILVIQTREAGDVTDEDVLSPLRGRVAPWWIPDAIIRLEQMPLASTGKIDKMRLRVDYGDC